MSEAQRVNRSRITSERHGARGRDPAAPETTPAAAAPAWAGAHTAAPFPLAGVQRKVTIGESNDAYEREASRVAADVSSGRAIAPSAISPIAGGLPPIGHRAAMPGEKKPEDKKKADKPEEKKKDEKPTPAPVRKADKPEEKKDDKPVAPPVQKAGRPEEKKKDEKPTPPPVQKADKPEEKKKDDRPKPAPVQKANKPDGEKKDEKPKPAPVQKADQPEDKKKDKKKDEKAQRPAPIQKADQPPGRKDDKKDDKSKPAPVQKADKPEAKKRDDKPKPAPKADKPEEKKKPDSTKPATAPTTAKPADAQNEKLKPAVTPKPSVPEEKKKEKTPAPVQKADQPPAKLDTPEPPDKKEDRKAVQRDAGAPGAPTPAMENAAAHAIQTRGAGEPMHAPTRRALESRMGVGLDGVRVHDDRSAHETADAIGAKAFTHGSDIWLGRGQSQADTSLMAHEATHVVQQAGGVHRMLVQRADPPAPDLPDKLESSAGTIYPKTPKMELPELKIPKFKDDLIKGKKENVTIKKGGEERPTGSEDQRNVWRTAVEPQVTAALPPKLKPIPGIRKGDSDKAVDDVRDTTDKTYVFSIGGKENYLVGDQDQIKQSLMFPRWGPTGQPRPLDVDHKEELQLGGGTDKGNLHMLDASANRSAGARIRNQIVRTVREAVKPHAGKDPFKKAEDQDPKAVLAKYEITYGKLTGDPALNPGGDGQPDQRWEEADVEGVEKPFAQLKPVNAAEAESKGLIGGPKSLVVFRTPSGGKPQKVKWGENKKSEKVSDATFLKGVKDVTINYEVGAGGSITGTVFRWEKTKKVIEEKPINWALKELGGVPYTVVVNEGSVLPSIKFAEFKLFSPIEFQQAGLDEAQGLVARGKIKPSLPFLKDLELDLIVEGESARVSKTFTKDDFKLPGPIQITEASLTLAVGTDGLSVAGDVLFKIDRLGQGGIHGKVSTTGGFELEGDFNFDSKLFDPAKVTVGYKEGVWRGSGEIGIKEGKVKGVKSATITAGFEGEKITATGSVKPAIPGIEQGDMSMSYSPEEGLLIAGTLTLKKDIPGLEGGSIKAQVAQPPGSDRYIVKATGEAVPKIPGVAAKLTITYDDGAFDVTGTAGYEKGMLKGSVTIGATNRPVGDDGVPSGPPPDKGEKITLYGGGSVTLKIAPWLQATAAIKLKPNGEIEVTGKIGLPAVLEIFKEKKLEKNIFKVGIDIPIVGVAVAGQRIGIFANISGGVDLEAGIGPGQLQELSLEVTYNPAHEDRTKVAGDAKLHIPAHAGLRLFVRGSLGVGIPIVSASAGLEIGGTLGLEGALDASVHVEWTPAKGLDLRAEAGVYVEPKFTFDITGFVLVEADLFITTIELYSKKWKFASFEYGSGLRLGMKFPVHYEEGKPFDISLSDVQFEVPNVNASDILSGLIKRIA